MKRRKAQIAIALSAAMALTTVVPGMAAGYRAGFPAAVTKESTEEPKAVESVQAAGSNEVNVDVTDQDQTGPRAYININGQMTELTENTAPYFNKNVSLKFSDDKALGYYILNGKERPTGLNGTWGDGNFQNISSYLNMGNGEDGRNDLTVYDKAGNVKKFVFYIDQTAPVITDVSYSPSNSSFSQSKTVTITADEAVAAPEGWSEVEGSDGRKFEKTYYATAKENVTVTDRAGNTGNAEVEVKRIDNTVPEAASVTYSNVVDGKAVLTNKDVTVRVVTNTECQAPEGWKRVNASKKNTFEKVYTANTEETVTFLNLSGKEGTVFISVTGIDKSAPKAQISTGGELQDIDQSKPYNINISLKFSDNAALDYYVLNGKEKPTGITGQWGDGNYQNIRNYLNTGNGEAGKNMLTVWDKAGNSTEYTFYVDQTAPNVTVDVEKPDQPTPTKTVTLTGDEPFKVNNSSVSKMRFTAQNDDDGDGYATVWKASAGHPAYEGVEVEDQLGNRTSVAVLVTNVDSTKPVAKINYTVTEPTNGVVPVQLVWNTYPSEDVENRLIADGWTKTEDVPATFVKLFRENTHVVYDNIKSFTGVPGDDIVIDITNIDKTGPEVTVEVDNPDQMTYTKNITLTGDEPFKVYMTDESNLLFTAQNDDDGDGYATVWKTSTQKPVDESYTVKDKLGNTSSVGVLVTNIDSTVPEATVNYTYKDPTSNDVPVQIVWNTQLSGETDQMLKADGWKKTVDDPATYVRIFKDNETLTYTNIKSHTGIPGKTLEVTVSNITEEVKLNIYDEENGVQVDEPALTVQKGAEQIDYEQVLDKIPAGYDYIGEKTALEINDGYVYVPVKLTETTKEISVNYYIEDEDRYVEGKVEVDRDATQVNTSKLTDIPEGYEVVNSGDVAINDGWIFVELRKIETTREIVLNFYDEENAVQVKEETMTVDKDAWKINTSDITVPEGYELVSSGDLSISSDGYVYIGLRPVPMTKEIGVNYYISAEGRYVDGKVVVDKDATQVNTSKLTDIPEGYEVVNSGDVTINDGWIFVELRKIETTKEIILNFYDEINGVQVKEEKMTVDKDAVNVNTSKLAVPEGYEVISLGDLPITSDGYVYVGIRPIEGMEAAKLVVNFVGQFGETIDVEPVTVSKVGQEGQWATFEYGEDWVIPEGYAFAEEFDESTAKQSFMVKYGETLEIPEIGIVPVE